MRIVEKLCFTCISQKRQIKVDIYKNKYCMNCTPRAKMGQI